MNEIPLFKVFMSEYVKTNLPKVLESGMITQGKQVEEFEEQLKTFFNHPYILTLNSATSGLTLALRLLNLNPGDEVLSTPLTCTATNWPILANNLKIKWIDTDPDTCNINLDDLESKISNNTKALLFVHWAGIPVDLDRVDKIVDRKFPIIEDCAHAFGSTLNNKFLGTKNIGVYSLQAIKHLTTGDGGLIFLPTEKLYKRAKLLRWYGIDREYRSSGDFRMEHDIKEWGYKFHMNDINATIGMCNLPFIHNLLDIARLNAKIYNEEFKNLKHVRLLKILPNSVPSWWIYTLKIDKRDEFIEFAKHKKIIVSQVHRRNDVHSCVSESKANLPYLDQLEKEYVSIPVGWWIREFERTQIIKCVKQWNNLCDVKIRKVCEEDYDSNFLSLFKQLNGVEIKLSREEFKQKLKYAGHVYILLFNDEIVCTAKLLIEEKFYTNIGHIEDVICDEKYRRGGFTSYLINFITKKYYNQVYKFVLSSNHKNIYFYEQLGFKGENISFTKYI